MYIMLSEVFARFESGLVNARALGTNKSKFRELIL